mgnify:CR=1 FL=1
MIISLSGGPLGGTDVEWPDNNGTITEWECRQFSGEWYRMDPSGSAIYVGKKAPDGALIGQ